MKKNKIIVIGIGKLGANIAAFNSLNGEDVIVIDKDNSSFKKLPSTFSGYEVIGDATNLKLLESASIKDAKEVDIVTGWDSTNILIAHICLFEYGVKQIFIRLTDNEKARLLDTSRIKIISPFSLSLNDYKARREN